MANVYYIIYRSYWELRDTMIMLLVESLHWRNQISKIDLSPSLKRLKGKLCEVVKWVIENQTSRWYLLVVS